MDRGVRRVQAQKSRFGTARSRLNFGRCTVYFWAEIHRRNDLALISKTRRRLCRRRRVRN
jgi:hypothetical protein